MSATTIVPYEELDDITVDFPVSLSKPSDGKFLFVLASLQPPAHSGGAYSRLRFDTLVFGNFLATAAVDATA